MADDLTSVRSNVDKPELVYDTDQICNVEKETVDDCLVLNQQQSCRSQRHKVSNAGTRKDEFCTENKPRPEVKRSPSKAQHNVNST